MPDTDVRLYRLAAGAGMLAAAVLVVNVLRRLEVVPTNPLTHAVAPFAATLSLFALTGLFLWRRSTLGTLGLVGYAASVVGLAGAVGTEFVVHFVFAHLPAAEVDRLVAGPTRPALVAVATVFTVGALAFGAALLRDDAFPRPAAAVYLVTMAAFGWRNLLPELLVTADGVLAAAAIVRLCAVLRTARMQPDSVPAGRA